MTTLSMPIPATHAARSDVGHQRTINEDRYLAAPPLFAVADGLGGRNAGETAAQILVDELPGSVGRATGPDVLVTACERINRRIAEAADADPELRGMSTTCVVLQFADGLAHIAHVGDSRAYLLRQQSLTRLTDDHTVVGELVRSGNLTPEQADQHDRRHVLTQALGAVDRVDVATTSVRVEPGDRFLLCSDGLSAQVRDERIAQALVENGASGVAADELVALANAAGGVDNVTVIVVDADASLVAGGGAAAADHSRRGRSSTRLWAAILLLSALVAVGLLAGFVIGGGIRGEPGATPGPSLVPATEAPTDAIPAEPSGDPAATPGQGGLPSDAPIPSAEEAPSAAVP
jgi:protein phosphatase